MPTRKKTKSAGSPAGPERIPTTGPRASTLEDPTQLSEQEFFERVKNQDTRAELEKKITNQIDFIKALREPFASTITEFEKLEEQGEIVGVKALRSQGRSLRRLFNIVSEPQTDITPEMMRSLRESWLRFFELSAQVVHSLRDYARDKSEPLPEAESAEVPGQDEPTADHSPTSTPPAEPPASDSVSGDTTAYRTWPPTEVRAEPPEIRTKASGTGSASVRGRWGSSGDLAQEVSPADPTSLSSEQLRELSGASSIETQEKAHDIATETWYQDARAQVRRSIELLQKVDSSDPTFLSTHQEALNEHRQLLEQTLDLLDGIEDRNAATPKERTILAKYLRTLVEDYDADLAELDQLVPAATIQAEPAPPAMPASPEPASAGDASPETSPQPPSVADVEASASPEVMADSVDFIDGAVNRVQSHIADILQRNPQLILDPEVHRLERIGDELVSLRDGEHLSAEDRERARQLTTEADALITSIYSSFGEERGRERAEKATRMSRFESALNGKDELPPAEVLPAEIKYSDLRELRKAYRDLEREIAQDEVAFYNTFGPRRLIQKMDQLNEGKLAEFFGLRPPALPQSIQDKWARLDEISQQLDGMHEQIMLQRSLRGQKTDDEKAAYLEKYKTARYNRFVADESDAHLGRQERMLSNKEIAALGDTALLRNEYIDRYRRQRYDTAVMKRLGNRLARQEENLSPAQQKAKRSWKRALLRGGSIAASGALFGAAVATGGTALIAARGALLTATLWGASAGGAAVAGIDPLLKRRVTRRQERLDEMATLHTATHSAENLIDEKGTYRRLGMAVANAERERVVGRRAAAVAAGAATAGVVGFSGGADEALQSGQEAVVPPAEPVAPVPPTPELAPTPPALEPASAPPPSVPEAPPAPTIEVFPQELESTPPAAAPEAPAPDTAIEDAMSSADVIQEVPASESDMAAGAAAAIAAEAVERVPDVHAVQAGDNLWKIMDGRAPGREMSAALAEIPASQRDAALVALFDRVDDDSALREAIGMRSNNADRIFVGEQLNIAPLEQALRDIAVERGWIAGETATVEVPAPAAATDVAATEVLASDVSEAPLAPEESETAAAAAETPSTANDTALASLEFPPAAIDGRVEAYFQNFDIDTEKPGALSRLLGAGPSTADRILESGLTVGELGRLAADPSALAARAAEIGDVTPERLGQLAADVERLSSLGIPVTNDMPYADFLRQAAAASLREEALPRTA